MHFSAADFLAGLFGDTQAGQQEGAGEALASPGDEHHLLDARTLLSGTSEALADRGGDPVYGDLWVLRPDADGRMGWEPADLPEEERWWAKWRWDELPGGGIARQETREPVGPCAWCGRSTWWRSVYGVVICGNCHPPAVPGLVAEWIERDETVQVEKPNVQEPGCCVSTG